MEFKYLFSPMKIGKCEIPNRTVVPAMVANMCPDNGLASEQYIKYHEEKAKGGFGLIITEDYRVNPNAGGYPHICGLWSEEQIPSHKKLTDTIHKYESKIFCQIYHAGRQATSGVNGGMQPVSCSPIPCRKSGSANSTTSASTRRRPSGKPSYPLISAPTPLWRKWRRSCVPTPSCACLSLSASSAPRTWRSARSSTR